MTNSRETCIISVSGNELAEKDVIYEETLADILGNDILFR